MQTTLDRFRQGLALVTWTLVLALSVAVPVLERSEILSEPVAESQHSPGTCPPAHDHTLCTHVTSHQLAASSAVSDEVTRTFALQLPRAALDRIAGPTGRDANPCRAPPVRT
jgi:hypothetical protein